MASEFDEQYRDALLELTFNSKPVINSLTMLADEYQQFAEIVVRNIVRKAEQEAPDNRMHLIYLTDSICKNVRGPYLALFGERATPLFIDTYRDGHSETRRRLLHLLKTWEDAKVFAPEILSHIHSTIGQRGQLDARKVHVNPNFAGAAAPVVHGSGAGAGVPPPKRHSDGRYDDPAKRPRYDDRPAQPPVDPYAARDRHYDRHDPHRVTSSSSRYAEVDHRGGRAPYDDRYQDPYPTSTRGRSPVRHSGYRDRDDRRRDDPERRPHSDRYPHRSRSPPPRPGAGGPDAELWGILEQLERQLPPQRYDLARMVEDIRAGLHRGLNVRPQIDALAAALSHTQLAPVPVGAPVLPVSAYAPYGVAAMPPAPLYPTASVAPAIDPAQLLASLSESLRPYLGAGGAIAGAAGAPLSVPAPLPVFPTGPAPVPAGFIPPVYAAPMVVTPSTAPFVPTGVPFPSRSQIDIDGAISSFDRLDLKNRDEGVVYGMFDAFPLQCRTCGLRQLNQEGMSKHLDWHFKMNRREQRREKSAISQDWFMTESEWTPHHDYYSREAETPAFHEKLAEQERLLEQATHVTVHTVPVPSDIEPGTYTCPICHDKFETAWDDAEEAWLFKAAVRDEQGRIVHHQCLESTKLKVQVPSTPGGTNMKSDGPHVPSTPELKIGHKSADHELDIPPLEPANGGTAPAASSSTAASVSTTAVSIGE